MPKARPAEPALNQTAQRIAFQKFPQSTSNDAGHQAAAGAGSPSDSAMAAPFGVIVDDGMALSPGQIYRTHFMTALSAELERVANEELAPVGRTAAECPYLKHWLEFYRNRSAAAIERAIQKYARPERFDLESLRMAVVARVRTAVQAWIRSGGREVQAPEGVAWLGQNDGITEPTTSAGVQRLADDDPSHKRPAPNDAIGIQAQLKNGRPLEGSLRTRMERGLGSSFGDVRLHTDRDAMHLAGSFAATAFTVGSDIAFGEGQFRPGTLSGEAVIAHELAHVIQQRGSSNPTVPQSADEADAQLEREADLAAAHALIQMHGTVHEQSFFPEVHPTTGRGLRLSRCLFPSFGPSDDRNLDQVRADLEASGDLGPRTSPRPLPANYAPPDLTAPTPLSARDRVAVSENPPPLTTAEMALDLGTIEAQLERLEPLLRDRPDRAAALAAARARLTVIRRTIGTSNAAVQSRRILRTRVVLEESYRALTQLQILGGSLTQPGVSHATRYNQVTDRVTALFARAIGRTLEDDVLERFQEADQAAAQIPHSLVEADLDAFGSLSANAQMLQPSTTEMHAWATRLRPRLAALEERARQVAQARSAGAANLQTLEAQFRDHSDSLALSIEALHYYEQVVRGWGYIVSNPPPNVRALSSIARLRLRVHRMYEADERSDVALLEALVRNYRTDANVQSFLRSLPIIVAADRIIVGLGIVLIAAMATAGVGTGATAVIGTTTTTGGTITAFLGVSALEALTFTAVSRGLQTLIPGQAPQGSFLTDLAWNFGLFFLLRVGNLGAARVTAPVGLPAFTRLVQHTVSYPLLMGYGAIHFRISRGEWPTSDEFNRMAAETLVMMAGFAIITGRFRNSVTTQPRELRIFRERYGLQFEALNAGRQELSNQIMRAAGDTATAPDAVTADVSRRGGLLETELRSLIDRIRADSDIRIPQLRDALRGFGSATEAFALQIRLMNSGLSAQDIAGIESRIDVLPELARDPVRIQLGDAVEYATRVVSDLASRRLAIDAMARISTNPRIGGFGDWVRFSTAQRPGTAPAQQTRNFLDDVGELQVAETMSRSIQPDERVEIGGDARRRTRPGTDEFLPSFDITITSPRAPRNVEVYSPARTTPDIGDFGDAINHAADKIISDPALPAGYRTIGGIEAAIRINWPPPNNSTSAGTIQTAPNGDVTLITGNGREIPRGNFFRDYVDILNSTRSPAGARRVNVFTVYDRAGRELYRYTRNRTTGIWSGVPL